MATSTRIESARCQAAAAPVGQRARGGPIGERNMASNLTAPDKKPSFLKSLADALAYAEQGPHERSELRFIALERRVAALERELGDR
jgi:hypothetical protein